MLTGMFGIWDDPPGELQGVERAAWVDWQLAPLTEFVRKGWIEDRCLPGDGSYTVIPLAAWSKAFAGPVLRLCGDDMFHRCHLRVHPRGRCRLAKRLKQR